MLRRRRFLQTIAGGAAAVGAAQSVEGHANDVAATGVNVGRPPAAEIPSDSLWERDTRSFIYLSDRQARYPSITKTEKGRLLVLFTRRTEAQEKTGAGDLMLVRRSVDGKWWMRPELVYESKEGEPRAAGTMTTLRSGRIVAPFTVLRDEGRASELRVLESNTGGEKWEVSSPVRTAPLAWAAPNGRPFELGDDLVLPVFGAMAEGDLQATHLVCGLLRSSDGGRTWGAWSLIADDRTGKFSYEYPAVLPLSNGTMVAILTRRSIRNTIDAPQVIVRTFSHDGGMTWTSPQQLVVGAWPCLLSVDAQTTICAYTGWCAWGEVRLIVSYDGFQTFKQDLSAVEQGWLPIPTDAPQKNLYPDKELKIEKYRTFWAYNPIPLPPVVPYLKGDWRAGHFGFPSLIALSSNQFMVVLGNRQKGSVYTDPPEECKIAIEKERIESITFQRLAAEPHAVTEPNIPKDRIGVRWELAESSTPERWREEAKQPPAGVSIVTKTGRWIRVKWKEKEYHEGTNNIVAMERGYWLKAGEDGLLLHTDLEITYSDDQGKVWHDANTDERVPLAAAAFPGGPMLETADSTLVLPVYGYLNDADMSVSLYVSALIRSYDGGRRWGDWSIVAYDKVRRFSAYSETVILPTRDGSWIALIRTECRTMVPFMGGMIARCRSFDQGRTWTEPEICFPGSQSSALVLPDGGIAAVVPRRHSRLEWKQHGWGVVRSR